MESDEVNLTMQALKAGALSVVEKPVSASHEDYAALAGRLCTQLAIMSEVKVVRQRETAEQRRPASSPPVRQCGSPPYRLLGVAASTGGPSALLQLLSGLGSDFPLPIAIVQHMTAGFMGGFAEWLGKVTSFPVSIISYTTPLMGGHVYRAQQLAHGGAGRLGFPGRRTPGRLAPSFRQHSILFDGAERGGAGIGVLLTGMGDDGAEGLRELRRAGGFTIAEAESTAVVYGMPAAAVRLGAACESLPVNDIASRILENIAVKTGRV